MYFQDLLPYFERVKIRGDQATAICPAHDDKSPSLTIKDCGDKTLIHCYAGCSIVEIADAIGLKVVDFFAESNQTPAEKKAHHKRLSREALTQIIWHELHVLMQYFDARFCDQAKRKDSDYMELHPEFMAMSWEPWERELLAKSRLINALRKLYD